MDQNIDEFIKKAEKCADESIMSGELVEAMLYNMGKITKNDLILFYYLPHAEYRYISQTGDIAGKDMGAFEQAGKEMNCDPKELFKKYCSVANKMSEYVNSRAAASRNKE